MNEEETSLFSSEFGQATYAYQRGIALMDAKFKAGQRVVKDGGDYRFEGVVVSVFAKRSNKVRYVVENADGVLHIFSESQLRGVPA